MKKKYVKKTKLGNIVLTIENQKIVSLELTNNTPDKIIDNNIAVRTFEQLEEYFNGERKFFDLPLDTRGTDFQKQVWKELQNIPYGKVVSYQYIAEKINNPKSYRAIGNANNKNPIPIIIPCHRVIGKNSDLKGFSLGLDLKKFLITLEKKFSSV